MEPMQVLCILSLDDSLQGDVTAVIELREGDDPDDVFVNWVVPQALSNRQLTRTELLGLPYTWQVKEVERQDR